MQNSSTYPSQTKRKKRDRGDHKSESTKRERAVKHNDGDLVQLKSESSLKSELAKITEKGGLVDSESVARLVQLMKPDKSQRRIDLSCRSMIAGILAATDKFDCLNQFVQLRGFLVLDEWLQEVHKGKTGDSGALKDGDKPVDDFLLVLLRALDKLPINLKALKSCNIGRSVNHLRWHKNLEIQRKSRSLVDTWKKRVEAEMNSDEAKSASGQAVPWTGRSRPEVSHVGNKHGTLSPTSATKSSGHVASWKSASVKHVHEETALKASSVSSGPQKSSSSPSSTAANLREGQIKTLVMGGYSEPLQTTVKEERSSSSSQSHTNSQCSSDLAAHMRNPVPSGKEDAGSSTARSKSMNKSTGSSRARKSACNIQGTSSGVQKDSGSGQISTLTRYSDSEKLSQCHVAGENAPAAPVVESNSHKIVVKISNQGRSPGPSAHTGSEEELSCKNSRASSPDHSEKLDQSDSSLRNKSIAYQTGEAHGLPSDGKECRTSMNSVKRSGVAKVTYSPSGKEISSGLLDSSLSPMNALTESCVKYSAADEVGMNLLACVAVREVSKNGSASPAVSPLRNTSNAGNPNTVCQGSASVNGEASSKSAEDLLQKEEPSLKTVGKVDEFVGDVSVPVSFADIVDKSASGGDEQIHVSNSLVKDKSHDPVTDTRQIASSSLPGKDVVKDEAPIEEAPGKDPDVSPQFVSTRHDYQKSDSNQELSSNAVTEHKQLPLTSSGHIITNEAQALESSGADLPLVRGSSSDLQAVNNTDDKDCIKLADGSENQKTNPEGDFPLNPIKQEESRSVSADPEQKTAPKDESLVKNDVGLHSGGPLYKDLFAGGGVKLVGSKNSALVAVQAEQKDATASDVADTSVSAAIVSSSDKKLEFDLNEGFNVEDVKNGEQINFATLPFSTPASLLGLSHSSSVSFPAGPLPAAVTVTAAAKGPFVPPEDLLRSKTELGWKGSAATSAFRPAEPRKVHEPPTGFHYKAPLHDVMAPKQVRPVLDIDLNVTDERILLDIGCQNTTEEIKPKTDGKNSCDSNGASKGPSSLRPSAGLELDLNRVDDASELGRPSTYQGQQFEASILSVKFSGEASTKRDFDLNDGPSLDETTIEPLAYRQSNLSNISPQPSFGPRMNSSVLENLPQMCPSGTTYSAVTIPSALPDNRGDQPFRITGAGGPQRILSVPAGSTSINHDFYRGSLLPSSPALPFGTTAFQYPVFPFGTSFPLSTSFLPGGSGPFMDPSSGARYCAPTISTQLVGTGGTVSSQFLHPFVTNLPNVSSSSSLVEISGKWNRQDLDLNSGPGGGDVERRDEVLHMASRQLPPQVLMDEQARMYQVAGGGSKRKEPEGGWETDRLSFKQSSWK